MSSTDRQLISEELFSELAKRADSSPRLRTNHNFHELSEVYQRFLNVLTKNTYVQAHRHKNPPKPETFIVLQGTLGFILFDEDGKVTETHLLSSSGPTFGIDLKPGIYHTIVCISDTCICFEGKSGPYDPNTDKEFAKWAPAESDLSKDKYLEFLLSHFTH
ncbi:cupin [Leptospira perolatii]|uniref:Cupin n=1 Tax=Leptospira perolatii TaxID=2023191 RepID=A0A2M9ZRI6_9LEPT|nr:WbuC family cupin fold metalloprotein [Leptospira perolatii]PJZ71011.1 cupin [Leptospira perolatii]PJZ74543.1 cupin [Leptospira perolatii]